MKTRSLLILSMIVSTPALPSIAHAELPERKSPLADAPAVRHRAELRQYRLEIGPGIISTVGQDFYHAVMVGGKASFFLSDWFALGAMAGHNLTPDMKTSFHERVNGVLPTTKNATDRAPTVVEAEQGMNKIAQVFALQAEVIPFSGKYSLFGKLFANYDFYAFGGLGFINFTGGRDACTTPGNSCPFVGMKMGANFGVGMHTYFTDWLSMNIEARDILLRNNPSGRDETGDQVADDEDLTWDSNYMVGVNFTFMLPPSSRKSD